MRRLRWVVVMLSALALAAGCGEDEAALTTTNSETAATSESTATTPEATTEADPSSPVELEYLALPPPKLRPGLVKTSKEFEPTVVFRVPEGWNGSQDSDGFGIGKGVDLEAEDFDRASIYVSRIDLPFAKATAKFEKLAGLKILSKKSSRLGRYEGQRYDILVPGEHVILEPLGLFADLPHGTGQPMFLAVRGQTFLIGVDGDTDADRAEAERVLRSFRFPD